MEQRISTLLLWAVLALFTVPLTGQNPPPCNFSGEVIVFDDQNAAPYDAWNQALNNLGLSYTNYGADFSNWNTAVGNADPANDIVIVDETLGFGFDFSASNLPAFITNGGRVIFYTFELDNEVGVTNLMKGEYDSDVFVPFDLYDWGGSNFFAGVSNPMNYSDDNVIVDGNAIMLTPMSTGQVVAGLTPTPAPGQGMVIVANAGRTILNGTSPDAATSQTEAVQFYQNQIEAVACATGCDPEAAFSYDLTTYCQNDTDPVITITGSAGTFTYSVVSGGTNLDLDASTGDVDLSESDPGVYEITNTVSGTPPSLVLTGVLDATLPGGQPKAAEFYVVQDIPDLSIYGVGVANNGGGSDGQEFTFPAVSATAGDYIYLTDSQADFQTWFGFPADFEGSFQVNGDDAVEVFENGVVVDIFGDINQDGSGQPWDYENGWAYRVSGTGPDGSTFVLGNWFFSGPNALNGVPNNNAANLPFPTATYNLCDIDGDLILTGVLDATLPGGQPKAAEFYVINDIADLSIYGVGVANNGGGSDGQEFTFPAVSASAGDYIYLTDDGASFQTWFGFPADFEGSFGVNGDDAVEVFENGAVVDIFGDINQSGSGQPWDYQDGWAYRVVGTGPDGSTFVLGSWNFSGANALDGESNNATAAVPFPAGSYDPQCGPMGMDDFMCSQVIEILAAPVADAGDNQAICGEGPAQLAATGTGVWSGGAGAFSDVNDPNATYTPDPSEVAATVALTWTANDPNGVCQGAEDIVYITFIPESDAEFMYDGIEFCPNAGILEVTHTTGQPGVFSYTVVNGGPNLDLDTETGTINTGNSDQGTYEVTNTVSGCGNLVITGVIDGPLTGGVPKAIELYALADIPDLSVYGVGSANNGGGSNGEEFSFPADAVTAGTFIYVASETTNFNNFFGFDPDYTSNALLINGDDAMELFCSGQVIDVFGDINVDGTGEPWDYLDGWAYRVDDTGIDGSVFQLDNWFFSGVNALDGETSNATAATPFPIGTYSSASTGVCADAVFTQTVTIEDTEGPELNCPSDIVITLDPGACGAFVTWEVTATDNCDPNPMFEQTLPIDLASGDYFEIGDYTIEYEAEDIYGNTSSCSFVVSILEFPNPTPSLSCNDLVQISLDENGVAIVGADDILEGGPYGCYDDYIVDVLNSFGFSIGNEVDCDDIGTTWGVMVTDPETGNQCWGEIVVEDKLAPEVQCQDYTISCTQDYETLPFPIALDNCDPSPDVQIVDNYVVDNDACDDDIAVVQRTFIAIDEYGNESALCTETITIERPEDVDFPNDIMWECDQYDVYPNITDPADLHPSVAALQTGTDLLDATGISNGTVLANTGSGIPLDLDGQFCGYQYTHADAVLDDCGTSFKIVRTWTVLDWCNSTVVTSNQAGEDNVQVIKVVDITGPSVSIAPFEVSANITGQHPMPCTSQDFLPPATITDNCNDWTVRIYTPIGEANYLNGVDGTNGGFIPAPGLELGVHTILYQAEDECGNITELFVDVEVVDDIAPTAICDEITDVNLSSDGLAVVNASVFDDGSYDNCCLEEFLVRRMDGDCEGNFDEFDPTVEFCCSDVAAGEPVMVVFRAVDCFGNANDCMVEVNVNDKLAPILTSCPPNATISCDDYLDNYAAGVEQEDYSVLDGFGGPSWYDNCDLEIDTNVTVNIDACSEGTITRSWTANDAAGNGPVTCTQTITVFHVSDWVVEFPADITVECVDGSLPDFGEPEVFFDECELIGTSFEDVYFYIVPDACYKIERYWTVINWCVYDEYGTDVWEEVADQDIIGFQDWNNDGEDDDRTFRDGWNESGLPGTPDGYIDYKQIIKVIDEDDPEFTIPAIDGCIVDTDCDTDITLPYPDITDECSPEFDVDITGDLGTFNNITADVTVSNVGVGTYTITYAVTDNCGNTAYQTFDLEVEDCKKPTPYCQDLVIEIMQTGMVEVWAEDFDAGSFDNCGPVKASFSMTDQNDDGLLLTCDDLGLNQIEVYFHDIYGNVDFCIIELNVQDNMNACGSATTLTVAGAVETEFDEAVADVEVEVNGGLFFEVTGQDGQFTFGNIQQGGDYTVTPMLDVDPANGVSTWDLVLISRHILQVENLDSPYKIIAADANKSGEVTTLDMVYIRQVILNMVAGFPNNTSWRFVDADYVFTNPQAPLAENFPEVINYNNISLSDLNADFVAVKVGDVNGSAATNANAGTGNRTFNGSLVLNAQDRTVKAGETFTVDFTAEAADLLGYQFTLNFNNAALELIDIEGEVADADNFGLALVEDGAITTSWNESTARAINGKLFGLTFTAKSDAKLSDLLSISSRYTVAESYSAGNGLQDVELTFNGQVAGAGFELYQNVPNPFEGVTMIGFNLPEATQATLTIMDVSGKVIKTIQSDFAKGYNEVRVSNIDATGVLYYQLATDNHTATKKMIIIE